MDNSREQDIRKQIDAYVKGQLGEAEIQELWVEFAKNSELLELLQLEVHVKELIEKEMAAPQKQATIKRLPSWTWQAAAAAVIVIVGLVQFFRVETPTELSQFVVQQISPNNLETAAVTRDTKATMTTADSLLNMGFEATISGDDDRALELFERVITNFDEEPYGSKAFLNKGIILYNDAKYEAAIEAFKQTVSRAANSRMIAEKANWYLGNALINVGQLQEAQQAIFEAYQLEGVFRNPAFRLLKKLRNDLGTSDYEELAPQKVN
jgi:TolA-binding protein